MTKEEESGERVMHVGVDLLCVALNYERLRDLVMQNEGYVPF